MPGRSINVNVFRIEFWVNADFAAVMARWFQAV